MTPDTTPQGPSIVFPLKAEFFHAIAAGTKTEEYRLCNDYWFKRLEGRTYSNVILTLGYPTAGDDTRRIVRPWRGCYRKTITHPLFGPGPVQVYAINVEKP